MKLSKAFLKALEGGMCAAPYQLDFQNFLCGDWDVHDGEFCWATPYPEDQHHWHPVSKYDPLVLGYNYIFFKGPSPPNVTNYAQLAQVMDQVHTIFTPLRECPVDVPGWLDEFHTYRASLQGAA